jgi:arsenate reductase (glutaredoxin)
MKATIWHNPACGTSRKTLAILQETPGVELAVVEYLVAPPSAAKLAQLYRDAGLAPQQGLRLRGTDAEERGLSEASDAAVLAAMQAEPKRVCGCADRRRRSTRFFDGCGPVLRPPPGGN